MRGYLLTDVFNPVQHFLFAFSIDYGGVAIPHSSFTRFTLLSRKGRGEFSFYVFYFKINIYHLSVIGF